MTTIYVDLQNGNDANNGTTFALRKKSLSNASIGLTGGDTIRVMKSLDPSLIGNCTWTANSKVVTLPSAVTAHISQAEATSFTVSANVTKTTSTAASDVHIGTAAVSITVGAAFTTGKIAYAPCATPNLSAYQQVSFFLRCSSSIAANTVYLDLCSDTLGNTRVVSFALPALAFMSYAAPFTFNYGANLPANINSIALRAATDPGTPTFVIDHIIACKAKTTDDGLTLNSLIGLNTAGEPEWYPIRAIDGTTLHLDVITLSGTIGWQGSVGSLPTYRLHPILLSEIYSTLATTGATPPPNFQLAVNGTSTAPLNIEFGYDTTNMSSVTGVTAVDFQTSAGTTVFYNADYIKIDNYVTARTYSSSMSITNYVELGTVHCVQPYSACTTVMAAVTDGYGVVKVGKFYITCAITPTSGNALYYFSADTVSYKYTSSINVGIFNVGLSAKTADIKTISLVGHRSFSVSGNGKINITNFSFIGNSSSVSGIMSIVGNLQIGSSTINSVPTCIGAPISSSASTCSIENLSTNVVNANIISLSPNTNLGKASAATTKLTIKNINSVLSGSGYDGMLKYSVESSIVHTSGAGKISWKVIPYLNNQPCSNTADWYNYQNMKISEILLKANTLATVTIWVYRLFTSTSCAIFVKPEVAGVNNWVVSSSTGAANSWEQLSLTFTPSVDCVIPVYFAAQFDTVNTSQAFYFDDFGVTQ